jgi:hypothetical protein
MVRSALDRDSLVSVQTFCLWLEGIPQPAGSIPPAAAHSHTLKSVATMIALTSLFLPVSNIFDLEDTTKRAGWQFGVVLAYQNLYPEFRMTAVIMCVTRPTTQPIKLRRETHRFIARDPATCDTRRMK